MNMMVTKTSENRQQLADIFGGDCSRIARIRTVLDEVVLSDMNCNDQRVRTCTEACETIEKVLEDMGLGWCLKKAQDEQKASFTRRRSSIDREDLQKAVLQIEAQATGATEAEVEAVQVVEVEERLSPKAKKAADAWAECYDEDFVKRVLACQQPGELQALESEAKASKATKLGNWMIWMVHRAHLDDPTLVKFDFTNLKMPEGNVEPLISPKLAVAMESNTHIEHLLMGCTNLQDQEAAILAVSLRSNRSLKVLNIDTNVIQPLTLESIANGTSVNEALQELRCNNTANGRLVTEAFLRALKSNPSLCKLGYPVTDAYFRGEIDKQLTRNNDAARKRRLEEKRRKEAGEAESEAAETKGYPHPPKADQQPERSPERIKEVKETVKEVLEVKEVITKKQELEEAPQLPEAEPAMLSEAGPTTETSPELKEAAVEPAEPCQAEAEPSPVAEDELKEPQAMTEEPCDEPERAGSSLKEARSKVSASDCEHARTDIPGTIEAFLGEGSKTSAPLPMRNLRGYLYKKSPGARLLKSWDWRYFVLHEGRLIWWRRDRDIPADEVFSHADPEGCKGFINFKVSRARIMPDEQNPLVFAIESVDGKWQEGSLKDMSDAQRTFEFDCTKSAHTREEWMDALRSTQQ
ncbi:unnamed protein product [Durusdinium trenchii]